MSQSRIIRESRASAKRLHEAGFISDARMAEFDAFLLPVTQQVSCVVCAAPSLDALCAACESK